MKKTIEKTEVETKEVKKEFNLQEAFVLWKNETKNGKHILKGHDLHGNKLVGFFNAMKKNPKEPDIRICEVDFDSEGKQATGKEICSLWENISKNEKPYLSGTTDEKEGIVAFYTNTEDEKKPYLRGYFKEDK